MNIKYLMLTVCAIGLNSAFGQTRLSLSPQLPKLGEKVILTYDPTGTKIDKQENILASALLFNQKGQAYGVDIPLIKMGSTWKAEVNMPDSITLIALRFQASIEGYMTVDKSTPDGYFIDFYNADNKPVKGNQLSKASYYQSFASMIFQMEQNSAKAMAALNKEYLAYPENRNKSLALYTSIVFNSKDSAKINALKEAQAIVFQQASSSEEDLIAAARVLGYSDRKAFDSLSAIIKIRYPAGKWVASAAAQATYMEFVREKDLAKKIALFEKAKQTPGNLYEQTMLQFIAIEYGRLNDKVNFEKYIAMLKDKSRLPATLNSLAWSLAAKDQNLDFAAYLSKLSLDILLSERENLAPSIYPPWDRLKENRGYYRMYADTYALILFKQGKYAEALNYQKQAILTSGIQGAEIYERYALCLEKTGQMIEAREALEKYIRLGKITAGMKDQLISIYSKTHAGLDGFNTYFAELEADARLAVKKALAKKMISEPAPLFALKDFDGQTISLASLKGKVVVIDFWATWCGPCKESFPGMQLAVTKFKNDPSVKFVFIDTWERVPNYADLVKSFIADNNYTFHVLYDEEIKDQKGKFKVVADYQVSGIPTKFVIDKTGKIVFKSIGYSGSAESLLYEMSAMIELASEQSGESVSPVKVK